MNRRNFLTTLFGAALAPVAVARVLSSPPPKYKVYRDMGDGDMLVGYKGSEYYRSGVINVPYIPLYYTRVVAKKLELKDKWTVEIS